MSMSNRRSVLGGLYGWLRLSFRSVLLLASPLLLSQTPLSVPTQLQGTEIVETVNRVRSYTDGGLPPPYRVDGEKVLDIPVVIAEAIVFSSGSRLVFGGSFGDRAERLIITKTLRIVPGSAEPPAVSWKRQTDLGSALPIEQKAPAGSPGGPGRDGVPGADGRSGNPGIPGRSGPTVYIFVEHIEGESLIVDLRGEDGGQGGRGQDGGDGGFGGRGEQGVSSLFDCRRGGGNGGNGGRGGRGGAGGPGGRGGNSGQLVIVSSSISAVAAAKFFRVDMRPGKPGGPGLPGNGGQGGAPGEGGSGIGLCSGGNRGTSLGSGLEGPPGDPGPDGATGIFAIAPLTAGQSQKLGLR